MIFDHDVKKVCHSRILIVSPFYKLKLNQLIMKEIKIEEIEMKE